MEKSVVITLIIVIGLVVIFLFGGFGVYVLAPSDDKKDKGGGKEDKKAK